MQSLTTSEYTPDRIEQEKIEELKRRVENVLQLVIGNSLDKFQDLWDGMKQSGIIIDNDSNEGTYDQFIQALKQVSISSDFWTSKVLYLAYLLATKPDVSERDIENIGIAVRTSTSLADIVALEES